MWPSRVCLPCAHLDADVGSIHGNTRGHCGLQADQMPVSLKIHTSPSGQSATWLSPKPEPHPNQSKQNLASHQESRETRKLCEFAVAVESIASTSGTASTCMICQENQAAFFHKLQNHVESYWTKDSKTILMTHEFTHSLLSFFSILRTMLQV